MKGRRDVLVLMSVITGWPNTITASEKRKRCLQILHNRNRYVRIKDSNIKKMSIQRISYSVSGINKVKHMELLNFDKPLLMGNVTYNEHKHK